MKTQSDFYNLQTMKTEQFLETIQGFITSNEPKAWTKEMAEIFSQRLAEGQDLAEKEGYCNDALDYHALGYALLDDIHEEAELLSYKLHSSDWVAFYDALDRHNFADATDALEFITGQQ